MTKLLLAGIALIALSSSAPAQSIKLSGPLTPFGQGYIREQKLAPDGQTILYLADHDAYGVTDLYATPVDGSAPPRRLSASLATNSTIGSGVLGFHDFQVASDGQHSVYVADLAGYSGQALYSTRNDGTAPPVALYRLLSAINYIAGFGITPDGSQVVYSAGESTSHELFRVAIDGSSASVRLHAQLPTDVSADFELITADGERAVYFLSRSYDLFSVRIDGSEPPIRLNAPQGSLARYIAFRSSPDGKRIVYTALASGFDAPAEVYSVPADGSQPAVKLNAPLPGGGDVRIYTEEGELAAFQISPDGRFVAYSADSVAGLSLYRVPIAGGVPPLRIDNVNTRFAFTPGGRSLVYQTSLELHIVQLDRSERMTLGRRLDRRLNTPLTGELESWTIAPDGTRVLYLWGPNFGIPELYSIALDPRASPVRLNGPLVAGTRVYPSYVISPDGRQVAYSAQQQNGSGVQDLFSVPADGSQTPIQLNDPALPSGTQSAFFSGDGVRVVYLSASGTPFTLGLFSVPADRSASPVRLTPTPPSRYGSVTEFRVSAGGRVTYLANQDVEDQVDLYGVPADGSAPATLLSDPEVPGVDVPTQYEVSADGQQAYFVNSREQLTSPQLLLFGAPTDGSAAPRKLVNGSARRVLPTIHVSPDGLRVAYLSTEFRQVQVDLFSVPTDGSRARVWLTTDQTTDAAVQEDFQITADGTRVVFRRTPSSGSTALFSVPLAGGQAPVRLSTSAFQFKLSPDGQRVIYGSGSTLYTIPVDGSSPAVAFTGSVAGQPFQIGSASRFVVYRTSAGPFSAAIDGSGSPIPLTSNLPAHSNLIGLLLSRGGAFHLVSPGTPGIPGEIVGAAIDGSLAPNRVTPSFPATTLVFSFAASESAGRIVYVADADQDEVYELYSVRMNGTGLIKLNPPLVSGGDVQASFPFRPEELQISPDGQTAFYIADQEQDEVFHLYAVPITGGPSVRLSGPMTEGGDVSSFKLGPGRRVVYAADQDTANAVELYSSAY